MPRPPNFFLVAIASANAAMTRYITVSKIVRISFCSIQNDLPQACGGCLPIKKFALFSRAIFLKLWYRVVALERGSIRSSPFSS
jgi:hypothetical protein